MADARAFFQIMAMPALLVPAPVPAPVIVRMLVRSHRIPR